MQSCNKNCKEVMKNAPATIKGLKGVGDVQKRLKEHKQSEAHEL